MLCRLAFTSTCRRLRALRDTSARLWSRLRVSGEKPTHSQLPVFLARGPKHVRELVLCADVEVNGMFPEQVEEGADPVYDPAVIQVCPSGRPVCAAVMPWSAPN